MVGSRPAFHGRATYESTMHSLVPLIPFLFAACEVDVAPLASVEDAVDHPEVERFAITPRAAVGTVGWTDGQQGTLWVAPVADSDADVPNPVTMWISSGWTDDAGRAAWVAQVGSRFDGRAGTWTVLGRAADEPWVSAVDDAAERHGLVSHPDAMVITLDASED